MRRSHIFIATVFIFNTFLCLVYPRELRAEVALTIGAQEAYDDNIFLEDDELVQAPTPAPGQLPITIPESSDGDPDDDFITHAYLGVSGAIPVHESVKVGVEAKGGAIFFANQSDEGRFTADSVIKIESQPGLLPEPFFAEVMSDLASGANNVAVAEGTAARQSETHTASFDFGIRDLEIFSKTDLGLAYRFARHDFLGEWTFSNRDSENKILDQDGSDYFSNGLTSSLTHHITKELAALLTADVSYMKFTSVDSSDAVEKEAADLDRIEYNFSTGVTYALSEKLDASAKVGVDFADYTDDPTTEFVVVNSDGTTSTVTRDVSGTDASLSFDGQINYRMDEATNLTASANQSTSSDTDGDRIITRTFSVNGTRGLGENFQLALGGRYTQFDQGKDLSGATDRFDVSASIRYAILESLSLGAGWNFTSQNAGDNNENPFLLSEDYDSHRFFISVSAGLLGLTG